MKRSEFEKFMEDNSAMFNLQGWPQYIKCELPEPFEPGKKYLLVIVPLDD